MASGKTMTIQEIMFLWARYHHPEHTWEQSQDLLNEIQTNGMPFGRTWNAELLFKRLWRLGFLTKPPKPYLVTPLGKFLYNRLNDLGMFSKVGSNGLPAFYIGMFELSESFVEDIMEEFKHEVRS